MFVGCGLAGGEGESLLIPADRVFGRERRAGGVTSAADVAEGFVEVGGPGGCYPVVREFGEGRRVLTDRLGFESLGDALMGALAAGQAELVVETVLDKRMREPIPVRRFTFGEHRGSHRSVQEVQQRVLVDVDQPCQHADVELAADHRRQTQDALRFVAEAFHAPSDHVVHAARQSKVVEVAGYGPAAVVAEHDPPRLAEMSYHLAGEEGVAVGLATQRVSQTHTRVVEVMTGRSRDQFDQLVVLQSDKRDPGDVRLAMQIREQPVERIAPADVGLAIRTRDRDVRRCRRSRDVP